MRRRFKKYYDVKLTKCKFVIGLFNNREKNCMTLVLPQLLFKKSHIYDITDYQYTNLAHIVHELINTYTRVNGNIHIDELPLGIDINNIIKSTYNGSNIRWVEVNTGAMIAHHKYVHESTMSKCVELVKAYKKRHEVRQSIIDDKIQLKRYMPGGVYYDSYIRKNEFDRNQYVYNSIQSRIDNKLEDINELTETIKILKKEIMKSIGKRDKKLLKYYLYLANKRMEK